MIYIVSHYVDSGIQYDDVPIQLEQTEVKTDQSGYSEAATRSCKSRSGARSKCRRAPYSPACSAAATTTTDEPADYSCGGYPEPKVCDYDADMSLHSFYNMGRAAAYQGLPPDSGSYKYGDVYSMHTPVAAPLCSSSDPVAMYPSYAGHQRYCDERTPAYRGRYDELLCHGSREHAYPALYMSPSVGAELRVGGSDSASDSQNVSSCAMQQAPSCSRSSSREECYAGRQEATATSHLQARYQLAAFSSNRSESSASDVDVVSEEQHAHARGIGNIRSSATANVDGLEEAARLVHRRLYDASRTSEETKKENGHEHHPSVIMCRQTFADDVVSTKINSRVDEQTAVRHSTDTASCAERVSNGHCDSLYGSTQLSYDGYKPCMSSYQNDLQPGHRSSYSVLTQPGYTSVIVDTQQYQLANGFVH